MRELLQDFLEPYHREPPIQGASSIRSRRSVHMNHTVEKGPEEHIGGQATDESIGEHMPLGGEVSFPICATLCE